MKLYEYAAAGLPVLARYTPEIGRRRESFVFTYQDKSELTQLFKWLVMERPQTPLPATEVAKHSWETIATRLLEFASTGTIERRDDGTAEAPAQPLLPDR